MQERKNADRLIESGVEALRAERAPAPETSRVVAHKSPYRAIAAIVAVVAVASVALMFVPRESAAADLKGISEALQKLPPREEVRYVQLKDGLYEIEMKLVVDEDEALLIEKDAVTQQWKDDKLTIVHDGFATVQRAPKPDWSMKTFILRQCLDNAIKGTVKKREVKSDDPAYLALALRSVDSKIVLDRYVFDVKLEDQIGHVTFDVDRSTYRPIVVQTQITGELSTAIRFDYQVQNLKFDPSIPGPVRIYDIDKQRQQILEGFTSPVMSVDYGLEKVLLHAAIIDHEGNLTLIYSDTDPLPIAFDRLTIVPKEMQEEGATLSLMPVSADGTTFEMITYKDRRVAIVSVKLNEESRKLDCLKSVKVPIQKYGLFFQVELTDVPLMRTGSTLALLAPEKVPFWTKQTLDILSLPTKGGG